MKLTYEELESKLTLAQAACARKDEALKAAAAKMFTSDGKRYRLIETAQECERALSPNIGQAFAERLRVAEAHADAHTERSVGAMQIAEGDEGHEAIPRDCPMLVAVSNLRRDYDLLRGQPRPTIAEVLERDAALARVKTLEAQLAQCFKLSGADPDGDEDWRLAPRAVEEVARLRKNYDAACDEALSALSEGKDSKSVGRIVKLELCPKCQQPGIASENIGPRFCLRCDYVEAPKPAPTANREPEIHTRFEP